TAVGGVRRRAFGAGGPGGSRPWRDGATLAAVAAPEVARAVATARLVIEAGEPATLARFVPPHKGAVLLWPAARRQEGGGDWYVQPPGPSPPAAALAGAPRASPPAGRGPVGPAPPRAAAGGPPAAGG